MMGALYTKGKEKLLASTTPINLLTDTIKCALERSTSFCPALPMRGASC